MFITLIVVMISQVYVYVQTHQIIYIKMYSFCISITFQFKNKHIHTYTKTPWLMWLSWLNHQPKCSVNQKVMGLIQVRAYAWVGGSVPSQGLCDSQSMFLSHTDVSLPLPLPPFSSLKSINMTSDENFLQKCSVCISITFQQRCKIWQA